MIEVGQIKIDGIKEAEPQTEVLPGKQNVTLNTRVGAKAAKPV